MGRKGLLWLIVMALLLAGGCRKEPVHSRSPKPAETPLHKAAREGDVERVRALVAGGADINARDRKGRTPLHHAASRGQVEVAKLLIAAGADINAVADDGSSMWVSLTGTPLHHAVEGGYRELVEILIDSGADTEAVGRYDKTPLQWAAQNGRLDMVKLLIAKGANVDTQAGEDYPYSGRPLAAAIREGHVDVVEALLTGSADVNARDRFGRTALHEAIVSEYRAAVQSAVGGEFADASQADGDRMGASLARTRARLASRTVGLLVARGADVNAKDESGLTPLHGAAHLGLQGIVELLIRAGADASAMTHDHTGDGFTPQWFSQRHGMGIGVTPLHDAAVSDEPNVVSLLVAHGARVNAADQSGRTTLHYAARCGVRDIVELLIARGADVNAKDDKNATPLVGALLAMNVEVAKVLIAAGAQRVNVKDHPAKESVDGALVPVPLLHRGFRFDYNRTRLGESTVADANLGDRRREYIELLLANGADVNERDNGDTLLHVTARAGDEATARLLVTHGADVGARNASGTTPLHCAASGGHPALVLLLLSNGASVNAPDNDGDTPLHSAALRGYKEVVALLVARGANLNAQDDGGRTPLDEAMRRGHRDVVWLLSGGTEDVNPDTRDSGARE